MNILINIIYHKQTPFKTGIIRIICDKNNRIKMNASFHVQRLINLQR